MEPKIKIEFKNRRHEELDWNAKNLKRWLKNTSGEIRIGIKQAEEMNFDFSDEGIMALYKHGIFVDVVIRNVNEDDFLPERLEKANKDENLIARIDNNEEQGFIRIKIVKFPGETLEMIEIVNLLKNQIPGYDFSISYRLRNKGIDGFFNIKIKRGNKILDLQETKALFCNAISNDYEFHLEI